MKTVANRRKRVHSGCCMLGKKGEIKADKIQAWVGNWTTDDGEVKRLSYL